MQTANKVWLTPHEVEQMYGISRGLLWLLRGTGEVQSATIGSRGLRMSRASLDAYMARRAQDASDG
jgi:predicted DNA-binding transcriptional regulator AlpA